MHGNTKIKFCKEIIVQSNILERNSILYVMTTKLIRIGVEIRLQTFGNSVPAAMSGPFLWLLCPLTYPSSMKLKNGLKSKQN